MRIEDIKNISDVLDYCVEENVTQRDFIHETYAVNARYRIKKELGERIRKLVEDRPLYKTASNGSVWKVELYDDVGSGRDVGYESHGFSIEKIKIEVAENELVEVLDYCIRENITQRDFIHKACAMSAKYWIRKDYGEKIRKLVEDGPHYKTARNGSIWRVELYDDVGSGRDAGYESHGFSVEKIKIE